MTKGELKTTVSQLNQAWLGARNWAPNKPRMAFYDYLMAVLTWYAELREKKASKKTAARIVNIFGVSISSETHPLAIIIAASSSELAKTRSRWARALRYAWKHRKRWHDHMPLRQFLELNGGVAGCAQKLAANATPVVARSK